MSSKRQLQEDLQRKPKWRPQTDDSVPMDTTQELNRLSVNKKNEKYCKRRKDIESSEAMTEDFKEVALERFAATTGNLGTTRRGSHSGGCQDAANGAEAPKLARQE